MNSKTHLIGLMTALSLSLSLSVGSNCIDLFDNSFGGNYTIILLHWSLPDYVLIAGSTLCVPNNNHQLT